MARRVPRLAALLALAALGLAAAGCGGSGSAAPATTTTTTTATAGRRQAAQAFQACLKAHGVTAPGFPRRRRGNGNGPPPTATTPPTTTGRGRFAPRNLSPKLRQAFMACRSTLPRGGFFPGGRRRPSTSTTGNGAFVRYTRCLSQHGVKLGASSPARFRKAQAACRKLLPARPAGG